MTTLAERCGSIWNSIRQSPTQLPSGVTIPHGQVESGNQTSDLFTPNRHYFQVRVNEMFLSSGREWFAKYDPMVFAVSEFVYDKKREAIPFVVGPAMMQKFGRNLPEGMIFSDTRVAGLHPYRGGQLTLSIILYKVQTSNMVRKLLAMIENTANVLDFANALDTYLKVADVVMDGVESLLDLGGSEPVMGLREEFDPSDGRLRPSFFALINMPKNELDTNKLWVRDRTLYYGESSESASPFRRADFVLYSVTQVPERSDLTTLPFYPQWEHTQREALDPREDSWTSAKANMASLMQTMLLSPDLTDHQAHQLVKEWSNKLVNFHKMAVGNANMSDGKSKKAPEKMEDARAQSLAFLKETAG
ncbi:MAG: hypothetical protein R3281_12885 [Balneolaceae bacterium]|nr:hypothetical protein [Balneolaceae bacterium]